MAGGWCRWRGGSGSHVLVGAYGVVAELVLWEDEGFGGRGEVQSCWGWNVCWGWRRREVLTTWISRAYLPTELCAALRAILPARASCYCWTGMRTGGEGPGPMDVVHWGGVSTRRLYTSRRELNNYRIIQIGFVGIIRVYAAREKQECRVAGRVRSRRRAVQTRSAVVSSSPDCVCAYVGMWCGRDGSRVVRVHFSPMPAPVAWLEEGPASPRPSSTPLVLDTEHDTHEEAAKGTDTGSRLLGGTRRNARLEEMSNSGVDAGREVVALCLHSTTWSDARRTVAAGIISPSG